MSEIYNIVSFLIDVISIALMASFAILFLGKSGIRDFVIERGTKLISELFSCDFCLSFWVSLILASILAILSNRPELLIVPIFSTPITRILL